MGENIFSRIASVNHGGEDECETSRTVFHNVQCAITIKILITLNADDFEQYCHNNFVTGMC